MKTNDKNTLCFLFISGDFGYDLDSVSKFIANATFYFLAKQLIELIICNHNVLFNVKAQCFWQDNGRRGDLFMNQVEPMAAFLPYMTLPGNHEMQ